MPSGVEPGWLLQATLCHRVLLCYQEPTSLCLEFSLSQRSYDALEAKTQSLPRFTAALPELPCMT